MTVESNERSSHMEDPFLMGHSVHFGGEDRDRDENFHESKEQLDRTICRPPFMIFFFLHFRPRSNTVGLLFGVFHTVFEGEMVQCRDVSF